VVDPAGAPGERPGVDDREHEPRDDQRGHRGVEDLPREVDQRPLEVQRLDVFAGGTEQRQLLQLLEQSALVVGERVVVVVVDARSIWPIFGL